MLDKLGSPERAVPALHYAGTNGKGSCVATTEAILRGCGLRVGSYTSPHLVDYRERIRVDGECIPRRVVLSWLEEHTTPIEELGLTFFEVTTVLAFDWFRRAGCEVMVVETGLGGRLDATNVLDPLAAAVVSIGLEHVDLLGGTFEAVAAEKGGIFKRRRAAVIGSCPAPAREVLRQSAAAVGASPVIDVAEEYPVQGVNVGAAGTTATIGRNSGVTLTTPLPGRHQADNLACVLAMLDATKDDLGLDLSDIGTHLRKVVLPGRFQRQGRFIFDVAHNPDGVRRLVETMRLVQPDRPTSGLIAVLADKDWRAMLLMLSTVLDEMVLTVAPSAPGERVWPLDEVAAFVDAERLSARIESRFEAALGEASRGGATCLVTGSFHTVGDAMSLLQQPPAIR
jgi:dihydrofolate synthase / folylpolyglutamate synthase